MHDSSNTRDAWWPFGGPAGDSGTLLCFPFAGGGASAYRSWNDRVGPGVQVCPVQLPGREGRFREMPYRTLTDTAEALLDAVVPRVSPPFALFGYSMGAWIAVELTHRLAAAGRSLPVALFLAAARPPHLGDRSRSLHGLPDAEFRTALRELGGTPEAVLADEELMDLLIPILRADFEVTETYRYGEREPLPVPIVAFGGDRDPVVPVDDLDRWSDLTTGTFRAHVFEGDHFFFESHAPAMLADIRETLRHAG